MIKIGLVNIDTSHPLDFSKRLIEGGRARYTAIYNDGFRGEDEVEAFAKKVDMKICSSLEELADSVDVGFIQGCNWDKHLEHAMPFIRRNKPVFLDKPMVGNLADCRKILELEQQGAVILGSSSVRYCPEVQDFLNLPEAERGKVLHISMSVGVDEFNYAIHAVEGICAMVGAKPLSVRYVGQSQQDTQSCETYFVEFENGATACYHRVHGSYAKFNTIVLTTATNYSFTIDNSRLYSSLLEQLCNKLEGKPHCLASMEQITDSILVMLAGKCSKEAGGKTIRVDAPEMETVCFDGAAFQASYGAKAGKIYLL